MNLKVLNHASRTLPCLPYTNLKMSRTEKNNWLLSMPSRDSLQGSQCSIVNAEKSVWRVVVFLEVEEGGQDWDEEAVKVYS